VETFDDRLSVPRLRRSRMDDSVSSVAHLLVALHKKPQAYVSSRGAFS